MIHDLYFAINLEFGLMSLYQKIKFFSCFHLQKVKNKSEGTPILKLALVKKICQKNSAKNSAKNALKNLSKKSSKKLSKKFKNMCQKKLSKKCCQKEFVKINTVKKNRQNNLSKHFVKKIHQKIRHQVTPSNTQK